MTHLLGRGAGALFALVLLASAANLGLALTRPAAHADAVVEPALAGAYRPGELAGPGAGAVAAAAATSARVLTYDHRTLRADVRRAALGMTDRFAATYRRTFAAVTARSARREKAVVEGVVRGAGLIRVDDGGALCLVYVDQVLRSRRGRSIPAGAVLSRNQLRVSLVHRGARWLVTDVAAVPASR